MPIRPLLSLIVAVGILAIMAGAKACNDHGSVQATEVALHDAEKRVVKAQATLADYRKAGKAERCGPVTCDSYYADQEKEARDQLARVRAAYDERSSGLLVWQIIAGLLGALVIGGIVVVVRKLR